MGTYRYQRSIFEHIRFEVASAASQIGVAREKDAVQQILEAQRAVAEGREYCEGVGAAADQKCHQAVQQQRRWP